MKLIDKIDYELEINNFKKDINNLKQYIKNQSIYLYLKIGVMLITLFTSIVSFLKISSYDNPTSKDAGLFCLGVCCSMVTIILIIFVIYSLVADNIKYNKLKYEIFLEILNKDESIEEKVSFISKNNYFGPIHKFKEQTKFINNCKILKMQYDLEKEALYSRYVEDNEIKDSRIFCEIHYFENLDEPQIVLTNKNILLYVQYKNNMDFKTINIIPCEE